MSPDRSVTLTGVRVEADGPEGVVVLLDGVTSPSRPRAWR